MTESIWHSLSEKPGPNFSGETLRKLYKRTTPEMDLSPAPSWMEVGLPEKAMETLPCPG